MADLTGQRLSQYLILERISKGATSTVYKAYQEKLERYVAVKVLSPHFIDEEGFLERFKQEARAVAQLDHPNILPVYDFDQAGEVVYIVMKYVDTGTLKELMGVPLDLRLALEIVTQVGLALGYAHRQGVIHRDVKPGNILLGEGNWALLTDFGLAKMRAGDRKLTKSGIGMGTPDYMSPEQAQGLPVDGRADLYSLGCMLHEMVVGRVPFEADSGMAVVVKHITEPPRPPREINSKLPLAVEQVILRSLEKDPNKRYQTAEAMVADLARAVGRTDRFVLPEGLSKAASGESLSRPSLPSVRGRAPSMSAPVVKARDWLREKRPLVADGARSTGGRVAALAGRVRSRIDRRSAVGLIGLLAGGVIQLAAPALIVGWLIIVASGGWLIVSNDRVQQAIHSDRARDWAAKGRGLAARIGSGARAGAVGLGVRLRHIAGSLQASAAERQPKPAPPVKPARRTTSTTRPVPVKAKPPALKKATRAARVEESTQSVGLTRLQLVIAVLLILLVIFLLTVAALSTGNTAAPGSPTKSAVDIATESAAGTIQPSPTSKSAAPSGVSGVGCPSGMVLVTGGRFKMGATGGAFEADETPPHSVTLDSFCIDTVEVTVAQYARFISGSGYVTDAEQKGDAVTWRAVDVPDRQRHPVNRVSWNDADIFCRWFDKRLPTEAEWELAAKGFSENIYSWGNTFSSDRTNTQERGIGQPMPVGSSSNATPFGAVDMIGNVWEWTHDWYAGDYYANSPDIDPQGPASGAERVIRGGSFKSDGTRATTTIRRKASQDGWSDDIGFRCVRDVK